MSTRDDDLLDDALPTVIDPGGPSGTRDRPAAFDPHARLKPSRSAPPPGARPVAAQVISSLPPPRFDEPVAPKQRTPSSFDPHGRIDDSSRTAKWAPRELEDAPRAEEPTRRQKAPTKRGHDAAGKPAPRAAAAPPGRRAPAPPPPGPRSEPMRVISMKTPADLDAEEKAQRVLPVVKLRALADLQQTPPRGMGNLAPPRDPREARSRRVRDNIIWGSVAVIVASFVTLAIWFLARR